jgi:hypothetical protein
MLNYYQFILESNKINRKYYIFDWDDNILQMPTQIYLYDKEKGEEISVSTEEFSKVRNDDNYEYVDHSFVEFSDNGEMGDEAFIEDTKKALSKNKFSPSWDDFIECLRNGSLFAIVTARGHKPESIKDGVKYIIANVLSDEDFDDLIANLISFKSFYDNVNIQEDYNEYELIDEYLDKCGFYPISNEEIYNKFKLHPQKNQEELKLACIEDFTAKVKDLSKSNKAEMSMTIGFSDDDYKNASVVAKHSDIPVYYTKDTKKLL